VWLQRRRIVSHSRGGDHCCDGVYEHGRDAHEVHYLGCETDEVIIIRILSIFKPVSTDKSGISRLLLALFGLGTSCFIRIHTKTEVPSVMRPMTMNGSGKSPTCKHGDLVLCKYTHYDLISKSNTCARTYLE
jgi:hypothetical protein